MTSVGIMVGGNEMTPRDVVPVQGHGTDYVGPNRELPLTAQSGNRFIYTGGNHGPQRIRGMAQLLGPRWEIRRCHGLFCVPADLGGPSSAHTWHDQSGSRGGREPHLPQWVGPAALLYLCSQSQYGSRR